MAYTVSNLTQTVYGNHRVKVLRITADAATAVISTGLKFIDHVSYMPQSMTTASAKLAINEGAAGTATVGSIGISGVASGDEMILAVDGR